MREIILILARDEQEDITAAIFGSLAESSKRFWRPQLSPLVSQRPLWPLLMSSDLFPPAWLLWALLHEFLALPEKAAPAMAGLQDDLSFLIRLHPHIDMTTFICPVSRLSLVGLVAKA